MSTEVSCKGHFLEFHESNQPAKILSVCVWQKATLLEKTEFFFQFSLFSILIPSNVQFFFQSLPSDNLCRYVWIWRTLFLASSSAWFHTHHLDRWPSTDNQFLYSFWYHSLTSVTSCRHALTLMPSICKLSCNGRTLKEECLNNSVLYPLCEFEHFNSKGFGTTVS